MTEPRDLDLILSVASVDAEVFELRPDYRALLIAIDGIVPSASTTPDAVVDALIERAESAAREAVATGPIEDLAHIAAWREAYRQFGAKPQRTRNSLEALMRRAETAMPRVNRLTDIYNAISVIHQLPLGGEDLTRYDGAPQLRRAVGDEPFDTVAEGETVIEYPEVGEVVWCDDAGVTCRRWNWRQARRTALQDETTSALFILDALGAITDAELVAAADELVHHLSALGPEVRIARRIINAPTSPA